MMEEQTHGIIRVTNDSSQGLGVTKFHQLSLKGEMPGTVAGGDSLSLWDVVSPLGT